MMNKNIFKKIYVQNVYELFKKRLEEISKAHNIPYEEL